MLPLFFVLGITAAMAVGAEAPTLHVGGNVTIHPCMHHHRCNPDGMPVSEATQRAIATWGERELLMHIA